MGRGVGTVVLEPTPCGYQGMTSLDLGGPTPNQPRLGLCAMLRTYFMSLLSIINSTTHNSSLLKHIFKWRKASWAPFYCHDCRIVSDNIRTRRALYKICDKREPNGGRNSSLYQGDQWTIAGETSHSGPYMPASLLSAQGGPFGACVQEVKASSLVSLLLKTVILLEWTSCPFYLLSALLCIGPSFLFLFLFSYFRFDYSNNFLIIHFNLSVGFLVEPLHIMYLFSLEIIWMLNLAQSMQYCTTSQTLKKEGI